MRPWISSAVADGTVLALLSWPAFECVKSKSGPRRCLHRGTWSCSPSPQGWVPLIIRVHKQLFSFAHIQRETVVLAPWCKSLNLIQVCGLIIVGNEAQNHSIISKFDNRCGSVRGHAVMCVERVEQGTQDTALWGSYVQGDGVWDELAYFHHLMSAGEEVVSPQSEEFRLWSVSLEASLMGTIVLKAEL